jgi:hypothetical protein
MKKPKGREKYMKSKHVHQFSIERTLFDGKTGKISALDMRCDCGIPLWVENPSTHGEGPNRPLNINDL